MNKDDVKKLADLSYLKFSDEELISLADDFDGILSYINSLNEVEVEDLELEPVVKNIMREDDVSYSAGEFSEDLLDSAPQRDADYVRVNKVL